MHLFTQNSLAGSRPSHFNFDRLLKTLFSDHPQLKEWRNAFLAAYHHTPEKRVETLPAVPAVPNRSARAISFGVDQGKVRLDANRPNANEIDEHFRFFHVEALAATQAMVSDLPISSNEFGEVRETLCRCLEALAANPDMTNRPLVWREGRRLRRFLKVEKQKEVGAFTNISVMSAEHFGRLEEIVTLHNSLSSSDRVLADYDRRGTDPADQNLALGAQTAKNVVFDAASTPELILSEVPETLLPLLQDHQGTSSNERIRDASLGVDSTQNAVLVVLKEAVKEIKEDEKPGEFKKGFLSASGKIAAGSIAASATVTATAFVVKYSADIISFTHRIPGGESIRTIVEWIVKVVGT